MVASDLVIQTENLTKTYRKRRAAAKLALKNLNLSVHAGEIFGYLGPNGAGKTTTIRIMLDIIRPDSGSVRILGLDSRRDRIALHRRIGLMPGELSLWPYLTGSQVVHYSGRVHGRLDVAYVNQLAERFSLDLSSKVREYSTGNRRKLGIVLAFMHKPDVLVLDEPTTGLDPLMQQTFYQLVRELRDQGRTVFLSSHNLSEVQAICDHVGILRDGELKAIEDMETLVHTDFHWVTLTLCQPANPQSIRGVPGVSHVSVLEAQNKFRLRLVGPIGPLLQAVGAERIMDIYTEKPTLEEVFLAFYGETSAQANDRHKAAAEGIR